MLPMKPRKSKVGYVFVYRSMKNSFASVVGNFPFDPPPKLRFFAFVRRCLSSSTDCSNRGSNAVNSSFDTPVNALSNRGFLNACDVFI